MLLFVMAIFNHKLKGEYQYNNFFNVCENLNKISKKFRIFLAL